MKTKETVDTKVLAPEKLKTAKPKQSLRPMRSMVAVRSLKPKTTVATMMMKSEEMVERN
jgi:hypothetical protein